MDNIRRCYAGHTKDYDDNNLIIMMIKDACFILEWINMFEESPMWLDHLITYDLMLLENQIPFFVLEQVYECIQYKFDKNRVPVTKFIHPLVEYTNMFKGQIQVDTCTDHDHILAYICHCYRPKLRNTESGIPRTKIPSAVELDMAGIIFKPKKIDDDWPMGMEVKMVTTACIFGFLRKPTLRMPILRVNKSTELILRNLIAYELLSTLSGHYVTSYIRAMDVLIDTPEDVAKLVSSKVVVNQTGSNKEAADMINKICNEVVPESFYYTCEWNMLATYCESYWPKKIAMLKRYFIQLKHTYFNNPWSMIALFAGINLFVLAWVQTIYAVKSSFIK
ncbi:UPF0481 protein At3g47200-like [Bidens hawaiensis]|uniref:UPF0481 protein At3g47200-like n=1 Tax=Bidens hawaiensis TaxID=980011 RepID=UPI004048F5B6